MKKTRNTDTHRFGYLQQTSFLCIYQDCMISFTSREAKQTHGKMNEGKGSLGKTGLLNNGMLVKRAAKTRHPLRNNRPTGKTGLLRKKNLLSEGTR